MCRISKRYNSNNTEVKTKFNGNSDQMCHLYTKQEPNAIIGKHFKDALKKLYHNLCDEKGPNAIAWFEALDASS
eukprot:10921220-Ditylum_brightwellii.AAC.1